MIRRLEILALLVWVAVPAAAPAATSFTDDPVAAHTTSVRATHVSQLRAAIDALRSRVGLTGASWSDAALAAGTTPVRAVHVTELRTALAAAYQAAGLGVPSYTDGTITAGTTVVKAVHVNELRTAVHTIEAVNVNVSVTLAGGGTGTVTLSPGGTCAPTCSTSVPLGTSVTLTANPGAGSTFSGWSGSGISCAGTAPCTVTAITARNVTATFTSSQFGLTITVAGNGTGSVVSSPAGISCPGTCSASFAGGTLVTLTPSLGATGTLFAGWTGSCAGTGSCQITMNAARSATATFTHVTSLRAGTVDFTGALPALGSVTYPTKDGDTLTLTQAYPGLVRLFVTPTTLPGLVQSTSSASGGTVVGMTPLVGLYLVQVALGQEFAFLQAMYANPWVQDGTPASPAAQGNRVALDWNEPSDPSLCGEFHGSYVTEISGRRGSPTTLVDAKNAALDGNDLVDAALAQIESAHADGHRLVLNMSLQSGASNIAGTDRTTCITVACRTIQHQQFLFYRQFLAALEQTFLTTPDVADNTIIVIIAGNAGVALDSQLQALRNVFPNAFARTRIVGGSDASGNIISSFNHLSNNSSGNMVYARGEDVEVGGTICDGTSFAGPEVTSVLDAIWSQHPDLTATQVVQAFMQALAEMGQNGVLPQDSTGRVPAFFVDRAVFLAGPKTPATSISQFNGAYTGSYGGVATGEDEFGPFSEPVSGGVAFSVLNGAITISAPGSGSGSVALNGSGSIASGGGGVIPGDASCSFSATFVLSPTLHVSAGGAWFCSFDGGTASGGWSAAR